MWKIEFTDVDTNAVIGTVEFDGQGITASRTLLSVIADRGPQEILDDFDGWSNGYISSKKVTT